MSRYQNSSSTNNRHNRRRRMGMPDPIMVIGFGMVVLVAVVVWVLASRQPAQASVEPTAAARSTSAATRPAADAAPASTAGSVEQGLVIKRITNTPDPNATVVPTEAVPVTSQKDEPFKRTAKNWENWPVVPEMTTRALEIYREGQKNGRDAHAFSKVGDCESSATWFLEDFDKGPEWYSLGNDYAHLEKAIKYFKGSHGRTSLAARDGARVSTLFTSLWVDPTFCETSENPLTCEYRVHNPAFAIISLGSNDNDDVEKFEAEMRDVIDLTIEHHIVPILATKADDLEGGGRNNQVLAKLALEYDLPLWNFWAAVQDVPNGGLDWDGAHLTWSDNFFDQPGGLETGWAVRNLTALQVLEAMRSGVEASGD